MVKIDNELSIVSPKLRVSSVEGGVMDIRKAALDTLEFGAVDAESENALDKKFLKTSDFEIFLEPQTTLVLGAKGSGKSALFELFTKYERSARQWANGKLDKTLIVEGTGFRDLTEIDTDAIEELMKIPDFGYSKLWKLYFAIKIASKFSEKGIKSKGASNILLRDIGKADDWRIFPLLKKLWTSIVGKVPRIVKVPMVGEIPIGQRTISVDPSDVLMDINNVLSSMGTTAWVIFDKVDEIFPKDDVKRSEALSYLLQTSIECHSKYQNIRFKVFLRTDIWAHLSMTNKSHLLDKMLHLHWDKDRLCALLLKRACNNDQVVTYLRTYFPELTLEGIDEMTAEERDEVFYRIFARQIYKGAKEAKSINWMVDRVTDSLGGAYPREFIIFGNMAKTHQARKGHIQEGFLIDGQQILSAYYDVSKQRCESYLAEFPAYEKYFEAFAGKTNSTFSRVELKDMFPSTSIDFDDAIKELCQNIGVLRPLDSSYSAASSFEVPRLYVHGLGIIKKGRP